MVVICTQSYKWHQNKVFPHFYQSLKSQVWRQSLKVWKVQEVYNCNMLEMPGIHTISRQPCMWTVFRALQAFLCFFLQRESFLFVTDGIWLPIQPSARCSRPNDYARQINVNKLRSFIFEQVPVLISVARIELRDIKKWSDNAQFLLLRLTLSHNLIFSPQRAGFSISILIHELMDLGSLKPSKDIKEDNINLGWDIRIQTKMLGQELNVLVAKEAI